MIVETKAQRVVAKRPRAAQFAGLHAIGVDLSKSAFQLHASDVAGGTLFVKRLSREEFLPFLERLPRCLIGMESGASAHHWARELTKLGHDARIMPAQLVRPFRTGDKTDMKDAQAICEALLRPNMRFVPIKSTEHQSVAAIHTSRELLIKQRTQIANALRALFAEYGAATKVGVTHTVQLAERLIQEEPNSIPAHGLKVAKILLEQFYALQRQALDLEDILHAWHKDDEMSSRLTTIPGVGLITATALVALTIEATRFPSSRHFASWVGLTPAQRSSGSSTQSFGISRRGNSYLRKLLVTSAYTHIRKARRSPAEADQKTVEMLNRRPVKVVAVAGASRNARIAWALMTHGGTYDPRHLSNSDVNDGGCGHLTS